MTVESAVDLARHATHLCLLLSAPMLIAAVVVGVLFSALQTLTQIQEQSLGFVPKMIAMLLTMLVMLPWMLNRLVEYSTQLLRDIPSTF
jgi:flagellar biosynthetic protein FliQ